MGYRTTSKAENEIPHRLKENQAAANKTIQPPYTPDKGTQQQASVPRLAQLDVDEVPSAAGRKETTSTNPGQDSKGLGLARAHMGKSSYTSRPSTQMPTPNAQNPQVGAGGAPGPARSTQPLRVQPARVVHPLPAQVGSPGPAVATGTWDSTDSWAKPLNIKMPKPDSFYDIDFSTRPPPNIVVKIAHTVKDKSGKEVVQKPINPASQIDFPGLSKLTQSVAANTTSPPYKQTPLQQAKHSIPQHSTVRPYHDEQLTTVTPQQESSETPVKNDEQPKLAESLHVNAEISPQPTSNLTRAQPTAQDKASTPQPKGILRYFRPVASSQKQQDAGSKQELPSAAPVSTSLRTERRTEGGLFTDGTAFVAQALSNQKKKATDTLEVSAAQEKNSTADTSSGVTMDDVIANIYAKTVAPQQSGKPNISNKSVRGRSDGKRSIAAASLNFEDTFQGRNLSVPSETPVVLYRGRQAKNPYQTNEELGVPADYEPGQLRGWDGDWAPPPVEWDLRDMYDYRKPQHRESIKNYAIDRYLAFKKGLCPALNIGNDAFTSGASLAVGLSHFASPINPEAHHHIAATDPYTLNKYHQSAENAVKNYLHVNKYRLEAKEAKRQAKRLTAAEKKEMGKVSNLPTLKNNADSEICSAIRSDDADVAEQSSQPLEAGGQHLLPPGPCQRSATDSSNS